MRQRPQAADAAQTVLLRATRPPPPDAGVAERFAAAVFNTGNYFFEESLHRHLPGATVMHDARNLPPRVERLVLSMSNFINPANDLGWLAEALERRHVTQIVMIGAGAQAYDYGDDVALSAGTRRFLDLVADRSRSIGVRGCYTAELLDGMGIRNVEVIGCPSAFWQQCRGFALYPPALPHLPRLAVHATPVGHFRDRISALLGHAMRHDADYVMQSEQWMMPLLEDAGACDASLDGHLAYYAYPGCAASVLRAWLGRHLRIFFAIEDWVAAMRGYDFVYGARFHGNMAAIQAGVPALNLTFDTRTRELCEYLDLPFLPLQDFHAELRLAELYDRADFSLFNATYPRKLARYAGFLETAGLAHALPAPAPQDRHCDAGNGAAQVGAARARRVQARTARDLLDGALHSGCIEAGVFAALALRLQPARSAAMRAAVDRGEFAGLADAGRAEGDACGSEQPVQEPAQIAAAGIGAVAAAV